MGMVFYDFRGRGVAYCEDGCHIHLFDGSPIAYIEDDSVYSFKGIHLGWFRDGWILDHAGGHLLFKEDSRGGPIKPATLGVPARKAPKPCPEKGPKHMKALRPIAWITWSSLTPEEFLRLGTPVPDEGRGSREGKA